MKNIVVGITGGIAIYKVCELLSALKKKCYNIDVIMTENATKFINPLTFSTITKNNVSVSTFDTNFTYNVEHVSLAKKADLFIIVPATANIIAKLANGICDDMLTTTFLASNAQKVVCPAMNNNMYLNRITQDNINKLKHYDIDVIDPIVGLLACNETAIGKLADINTIIDYIDYNLPSNELKNKKVLISAGPTIQAIDPVRFITNHSSGKMGYALAEAALSMSASVTLISGKTNLRCNQYINKIDVISADDMYHNIIAIYKEYDYIIMCAAVSDYTPKKVSDIKIKKTTDLIIELEKTKDILKEIGTNKLKHQKICGFAMETNNLIENATKKLHEKNLDMIVANPINNDQAGFNSDYNIINIITNKHNIKYDLTSKQELAKIILNSLDNLDKE